MSSFHSEFAEFMSGFHLCHCVDKGIFKMDYHLGPEPGVIGKYMATVGLVLQPAKFMGNPILNVFSLNIG